MTQYNCSNLYLITRHLFSNFHLKNPTTVIKRTEVFLSIGGDDRLTINPETKTNKYLSSTLPTLDLIQRGSCTCSNPTQVRYESFSYETAHSSSALFTFSIMILYDFFFYHPFFLFTLILMFYLHLLLLLLHLLYFPYSSTLLYAIHKYHDVPLDSAQRSSSLACTLSRSSSLLFISLFI
jgi:hypothetical protein